VQKKWLKAAVLERGTEKHKYTISLITSGDFSQFCEQHPDKVIGSRMNPKRLQFLCSYGFPADHNLLLQVRQAKKEREMLAQQVWDEDADDEIECGDSGSIDEER
jgi:hypothetical protein